MAGSNKSTTLSMIIDVSANLDKIQSQLTKFQNNTKGLNLSESMTKGLNKTFSDLEQELLNFKNLSTKEVFGTKDMKDIEKSYSRISDLLRNLSIQGQTINGIDAEKLLPAEMINRFKNLQNTLKQLKQEQSDYSKTVETKTKEATQAEEKYQNALKNRQNLQQKITTNANIERDANEKIATSYEKINELLREKKKYETSRKNKNKELEEEQQLLNTLQKRVDAWKKFREIRKKGDSATPSEKGFATKYEKNNAEDIRLQKSGALTRQLTAQQQKVAELQTIKLSPEAEAEEAKIEQAIQKEQKLIDEQEKIAKKASNAKLGAIVKLSDLKGTDNLDELKSKFEALKAELNNLSQDSSGIDSFRQKLAEMNEVDISKIPTDLQEIQNYLNNMHADAMQRVAQGAQDAYINIQGAGDATKELGTALGGMKNQAGAFDALNEDAQMLQNRIKYFFGSINAINLFKRAVSSAISTVKELDATMTETAVVSDFSVADMWEQLPEYTKKASELGATINDLYEATTLYYQQGLDTQQAQEIAVETLKMARIAGLEAADATDLMTSALRGFNMEINETSAKNINDVYSQLAAITASDVEELGTAMSKTASIASSANMEFETTAAFLAQIIETTREAPETAGSAMKTIVARFSEVKELIDQGKTTGEDEEGEEINVNDIQKALRTVGISMDEFFAGTKGLDDILLELAEKWDTIDFATQRYIATTAAGSRLKNAS